MTKTIQRAVFAILFSWPWLVQAAEADKAISVSADKQGRCGAVVVAFKYAYADLLVTTSTVNDHASEQAE